MKIAISAESICDLSPELIKEFNIQILPFVVVLGDKEGRDGPISGQDLVEFGENSKQPVRTAAVSIGEYIEYFKNILKEYDEIIHISPSFQMSCAYQNASNAAKEIDENKVHVIESRALAGGIGCQLIYSAKLRDKGVPAKEIVAKVEERKLKTNTSLAIESVEFIYRGGRCSAIARFGANLLHLHPQIFMKEDGSLTTAKKFIGPRKRWMLQYVDETLKKFNNPDKEVVFLTHTIFDPKDFEILELAKQKLLDYGFKNVYITKASATIACHTGRNALACIYMNDGDHPVE